MRYLLLILLLFSSISWAQPFSVDITTSNDSVMLGEKIDVEVILYHPPTYEPQLDTIHDNIYTSLDIVNQYIPPPEILPTYLLQRIHYTLNTDTEGPAYFTLPLVAFSSRETNETMQCKGKLLNLTITTPETLTAYAPTFPLLPLHNTPQITISPEDKFRLQSYDNDILLSLQQQKHQLLATTLIILIIIFSIAIIYLIKKKRKSTPPPPTPTISPQERAIAALNALSALNLPAQQQYEPFYIQLTDIVRIFLEDQYHIPAPEKTSEEFLHDIQQQNLFHTNLQTNLTDFITTADLVKFAQQYSSPTQCSHALTTALSVVSEEIGDAGCKPNTKGA